MSILSEGSNRGYTAVYRDGTKKTNLTYLGSIELFHEAHQTENPCVVTPPGYAQTESI